MGSSTVRRKQITNTSVVPQQYQQSLQSEALHPFSLVASGRRLSVRSKQQPGKAKGGKEQLQGAAENSLDASERPSVAKEKADSGIRPQVTFIALCFGCQSCSGRLPGSSCPRTERRNPVASHPAGALLSPLGSC